MFRKKNKKQFMMMRFLKQILLIFMLTVLSPSLFAQDADSLKKLIYHPELDAKQQVTNALREAKKEHKNVILMVGGNWCRWCRMFQKFITDDASIDSIIKADYVFEHINYSKENKNLDLLKNLEFPQRFGFPVFVVLNAEGKRIHTQNSAYLESGEGYNPEKTFEFFEQWSPRALEPKQYEEQQNK
jgi:thioredoxin-related protein